MSEVRIRELTGLAELRACVELQEAVWGPDFGERVPSAILMVSQRLGGIVAGAFDQDERLIGFVFGMTGIENGEPVHWSDMLGTIPGVRDRGVGTRLKIFQRELCLNRGIRVMYWTYDPLQARNGWVNFGKLGAVSNEYARDLYGVSQSPLHRGLGTDRLIVRWLLDSRRAALRVRGDDTIPRSEELHDVALAFNVSEDGGPGRVEVEDGIDRGRLRVPVPNDIQEVRARSSEVARRWRAAIRESLEHAIDRGMQVSELLRGRGTVSHLLLEHTNEDGGTGDHE